MNEVHEEKNNVELMDTGIYKKKYLPEKWRYFIAGMEVVADVLMNPEDEAEAEFCSKLRHSIEVFRADVGTSMINQMIEFTSPEELAEMMAIVDMEGEYPEGTRPTWDDELDFDDDEEDVPFRE